jgi:hypothetical protein
MLAVLALLFGAASVTGALPLPLFGRSESAPRSQAVSLPAVAPSGGQPQAIAVDNSGSTSEVAGFDSPVPSIENALATDDNSAVDTGDDESVDDEVGDQEYPDTSAGSSEEG